MVAANRSQYDRSNGRLPGAAQRRSALSLIKWEQMVFLGNPEYGVNMAPLDFVKFAEAAGARGVHIEDPATCAEQLREAFSYDGPVIIECLVDAHEPPMPAKVKKAQVKKMAQALRQGTPNRNRIALQMVKDLLDESTYDASPGHVVPGKIGEAVSGVAGRLRDLANGEHPE